MRRLSGAADITPCRPQAEPAPAPPRGGGGSELRNPLLGADPLPLRASLHGMEHEARRLAAAAEEAVDAAFPSLPSMRPGDWICGNCAFHNYARNSNCRRCSAERGCGGPSAAAAALAASTQSSGGYGGAALLPGDWICSSCGDHQFARNSGCRSCGAAKGRSGLAAAADAGATAGLSGTPVLLGGGLPGYHAPRPMPTGHPGNTAAGVSAQSTRVVCLTNMVASPQEANDALARDVRDECGRFGAVHNVLIYDERQSDGTTTVKLFVHFGGQDGAVAAQRKMNGRYFDGRRIGATFFDEIFFHRLLAT